MRNSKVWKSALLLAFGLFAAGLVMAQDEEAIAEEDLQKYVAAMYKVDQMKAEGKEKYLEMIKSNELMQGGKRFNAIKKAKGDEAKLAELEVTEEELAAYNGLLEENAKIAANIKEQFTTIVKEEVGAGVYNKIKKQLKADEELKTKYDELYAALEAENTNTEETDD